MKSGSESESDDAKSSDYRDLKKDG